MNVRLALVVVGLFGLAIAAASPIAAKAAE
jgi:hypothetical protein